MTTMVVKRIFMDTEVNTIFLSVGIETISQVLHLVMIVLSMRQMRMRLMVVTIRVFIRAIVINVIIPRVSMGTVSTMGRTIRNSGKLESLGDIFNVTVMTMRIMGFVIDRILQRSIEAKGLSVVFVVTN